MDEQPHRPHVFDHPPLVPRLRLYDFAPIILIGLAMLVGATLFDLVRMP